MSAVSYSKKQEIHKLLAELKLSASWWRSYDTHQPVVFSRLLV